MDWRGVGALRASKAYIAGLGTTGVLLASSIALLFFVGALVGFDAWPGGNLGERVERVEVRPGEEAIGVADVVAPVPAAPAAVGVLPVAVAPPPTAALPAPPGPGAAPAPGGTAPAAPAPAATAPGAPADGPAGPAIDPRNPGTARDVVADTTQRATAELGTAVGQVSPEAGALIGGIGGGLADHLRKLPLSVNGR